MKRLLPAAEKGDANAQFNLGVLYCSRTDDNGYPMAGNRAEAIKWLLKSAQQGLPRAQSKLAEIYADGPEAASNCIKACTWFLLAMSGSNGAQRETAQLGFERLSSTMSPAQLARARRLAQAWKPRRQKPPQTAAIAP
ncbi:MAG: sel1 repeat family protein [Proteobacteria bacterium]|nr:sel1 repeat family protein [Pseudomonadota bacterium]